MANKLWDKIHTCKKLYTLTKYEDARITAREVLTALFPYMCEPEIADKSSYEALEASELVRELSDTNDATEFTMKLSRTLEFLDLYSALHERSTDNSPDMAPMKRSIEALQALFPGHLLVRRRHDISRGLLPEFIRLDAYGYYGNPTLVSYSDNNLEGKLADVSATFVEHVVSYRDFLNVNTDCLLPYLLFMGHLLNLSDVAGSEIAEAFNHVSTAAGDKATTSVGDSHGRAAAIFNKLNRRRQERLEQSCRDFLAFYAEHKREPPVIAQRLDAVVKDLAQEIRNLRDYRTGLMGFQNATDAGIVAFMEDIDMPRLASYASFQAIAKSTEERIGKFLDNQEIPPSYRDRDTLLKLMADVHLQVSNEKDIDKFFERMEKSIVVGAGYGQTKVGQRLKTWEKKTCPKDIEEAVACAKWDLGDEFLLLSFIDRGGFMKVYLGVQYSSIEQPKFHEFWAVKISSQSPRLREITSSITELGIATTANMIKSRNVCTINPHRSPKGFEYETEELYEETLSNKVEKVGKYPSREAELAMQQIGEGLKECHRLGIIHMDIKPENIGIKEGIHMLSDFGISRTELENISPNERGLGSIVGKAPELYEEGAHPTQKSDLYMVGVVLFYMCVGSYHYYVREYMDKHMDKLSFTPADMGTDSKPHHTQGTKRLKDIEELLVLKKSLTFYGQSLKAFMEITGDRGLTSVLARLLHPFPSRRYQDADALIKDIQQNIYI